MDLTECTSVGCLSLLSLFTVSGLRVAILLKIKVSYPTEVGGRKPSMFMVKQAHSNSMPELREMHHTVFLIGSLITDRVLDHFHLMMNLL